MNPFNVAIPLSLGLLVIGYIVRERSLRDLDTMQAGTLVLVIRPFRIRFVVVVGCVAVILLAARFAFGRSIPPPLAAPALAVFLSAIFIFQWAARRVLMRANLPPRFMRIYGIAQLLDLAGYTAFFGTALVSILVCGHA